MKALLTALVITFFSSQSWAQSYVDLFQVQQNGIPSRLAEQDIRPCSRFIETSGDLLLPVRLSERSVIITGLNAERVELRKDDKRFPVLYSMCFKMGLDVKLGESHQLTSVLLPRLSGTGDLKSTDAQIGGLILLKRHYSQRFNIKGGVYFNQEFFGPLFVPLIGFYYLHDRWEMNFTLPLKASIAYQVGNSKYRIGAAFDGINRSYLTTERRYVEKTNNEVGLFMERRLSNWVLRGFAGYGLYRNFTWYNKGDRADWALPIFKPNDQREKLQRINLDAPACRLSLTYRLPI